MFWKNDFFAISSWGDVPEVAFWQNRNNFCNWRSVGYWNYSNYVLFVIIASFKDINFGKNQHQFFLCIVVWEQEFWIKKSKIVLPRLLQSSYSHYLLAKDYSENHNVLSKSHIIDMELHTIFFNINHSEFINLMPFERYDLAC